MSRFAEHRHRYPVATCAAALTALLTAGGAVGQSGLGIEPVGTVAPTSRVSSYQVRDLDGDGRVEFTLLGVGGSVQVWRLAAGEFAPAGDQPLVLDDPDHALVALVDVVGDGPSELVVLDRSGVRCWSLDAAGAFSGEAVVLAPRARSSIRVGAPVFAEFVEDVNADGRPDLVVPIGHVSELWLQGSTANGDLPTFELTQTVAVSIERSIHHNAELLSSELRNGIEIGRLDIEDVNGDGRPDLRVGEGQRRLFYLQGADGRFAEQAIVADLSRFRDTTPRADVELGETLVVDDHAQIQSGDLNADGIPDYVIAHRRQVWRFLGTKDGPQFVDSVKRRVAEDVSGMVLVHLDDDDRDDLLVFKVTLPTAAELVLGLVSSIDIGILAIGYPTDPDGVFESKAGWRRELTLRIPSLLSLMSEAEDLMQRFQEVLSKFRWSAIGDFDGDGTDDLILLTESSDAVELWRRSGNIEVGRAGEVWLRKLLFENPDTVFDIERLLKLAAQVFDTRTSTLTGDAAADARAPLAEQPGRFVQDLIAADVDGDGRAEMILVDEEKETPGTPRFRVFRWVSR